MNTIEQNSAPEHLVMSEQTAIFECANCKKQETVIVKKSAMPPRGWVKMPDGYWCKNCKKDQLVGKPASLKVVGVVEFMDSEGKTDWKAFKERLKPALILSTGLSNACVEWLRSHDVIRTPRGYIWPNGDFVEGEKMPPMSPEMSADNLNAFIRENFGGLDSQTWGSIARQVHRAYGKSRFDSVCMRKTALVQFKYPYPLPFPSKDVRLTKNEDGNFVLRVRLLTGEPVHLILAKNHFYHNSNLEKVLNGEASIRESKLLYRNGKNGSSTETITERTPAARNKQRKEIWMRIILLRPLPITKREKEIELYVRTDTDSLLIAQKSESVVWRTNGDHLQRRINNHYHRLHRLSDDRKAQRGNTAARIVSVKINDVCARHNEYVDKAIKQHCGELANYAAGRHTTVVKYDDSVRDFVLKFPWRKMQDCLANALRSRGIELELLNVASDGAEISEDAEIETDGA